MMEYFQLLNVTPVPVIYDGIWDEKAIRQLEKTLDFEKDEGYVVRVADQFSYSEFRKSIAKYVRAGHVQTSRHWRAGARFNPNQLKKEIQ